MSTLHNDPYWPRASAWIGESSRDSAGSVALIGVPWNASITPGRCDLAPAAIRKALERLSTFDANTARDVRGLACLDRGDLPLVQGLEFELVRDAVALEREHGNPTVLLGGDNGLTRAGVHGLNVPLERTGLVTLDAHLDLRDTAAGLHNGNPVRALLEDGLPGSNIVQIGIAPFANSQEYFSVAKEAGILVVTSDEVAQAGIAKCVTDALDRLDFRADAVYFDLDIDVLDRAFAPACPGARPDGLTPRDAMVAARLAGEHSKVAALDIVEIDPERDINDATCLAAGQCLLSFASGLVSRFQA